MNKERLFEDGRPNLALHCSVSGCQLPHTVATRAALMAAVRDSCTEPAPLTTGLQLSVAQQVRITVYVAPRMVPLVVLLQEAESRQPWVLKPKNPLMEGNSVGG
ncbi:hypothetical protein AAFF_G00014640, partial [Aldrovandia affinis]